MTTLNPTLCPGSSVGYLRIATEDASASPEMLQLSNRFLERGAVDDPGFESLWGFYGKHQSPRARFINERLQDLGELRLADMDQRSIVGQVGNAKSAQAPVVKRYPDTPYTPVAMTGDSLR